MRYGRTIEEIRQFLGVDTLHFLSLDGLLSVMRRPGNHYCTACFSGEYRLDPDSARKSGLRPRRVSCRCFRRLRFISPKKELKWGLHFESRGGVGPFRVNLSKSGVGYSVGTRGMRTGVSARAGGCKYTSFGVPGTGIGYRTSKGPTDAIPQLGEQLGDWLESAAAQA